MSDTVNILLTADMPPPRADADSVIDGLLADYRTSDSPLRNLQELRRQCSLGSMSPQRFPSTTDMTNAHIGRLCSTALSEAADQDLYSFYRQFFRGYMATVVDPIELQENMYQSTISDQFQTNITTSEGETVTVPISAAGAYDAGYTQNEESPVQPRLDAATIASSSGWFNQVFAQMAALPKENQQLFVSEFSTLCLTNQSPILPIDPNNPQAGSVERGSLCTLAGIFQSRLEASEQATGDLPAPLNLGITQGNGLIKQ